jgi:hypothetical protein
VGDAGEGSEAPPDQGRQGRLVEPSRHPELGSGGRAMVFSELGDMYVGPRTARAETADETAAEELSPAWPPKD